MFCAECDRPVNIEADHYFADGNPPFWICRECNERTEADWKLDKQMLREQGLDPDKCTFIEDRLEKRVDDFHVIPNADVREHFKDVWMKCPCNPRKERQPNGSVLFIHNAWDNREFSEIAERIAED